MSSDDYEALRREYATTARRYDTRWSFYVEASIRQTLRRLPLGAEDSVLDVGCGTGALLEALLAAAPRARLAGVDLSEDMLEVARRRLGTSVRLNQARAEALPFEDASFDLVVSTNVFHFIRNPLAALREMIRVLKPAGTVVITDWCDDYLACRISDRFLRLFGRGHYRTYTSKECGELLAESGFASPEVERYKITWWWGMMTATASAPAR